ncbi:NUDIX hydrolase [Catenulispora yoronensis]|uniref:NUDIX hydrolase n=1 Tax=Catenulispora yoronensis TaxID=450799 RepID=UPI0031DBF59C
MNPDEELVYEVDENDKILRVVRRGELTDENLRHRCVYILFRDRAGRILVHRRAAAKRVFPKYYDMFVAGMVPAGETYDQAARREGGEEVGQHNVVLRRLGKFRFDHDKVPQWAAVYTATVSGPVVPQPEEVEWFGFLTEDELAESVKENDYCPDSLYFYARLRGESVAQPETES